MIKNTIHLNSNDHQFVKAHGAAKFEQGAYTLYWFPFCFKPVPDKEAVYELIKFSELPIDEFNNLDILPFNVENPVFKAEEYDKYIKHRIDTGQPAMTRTQVEFAKWLYEDDNLKIITQIGDLQSIFNSVYEWEIYKSKIQTNKP